CGPADPHWGGAPALRLPPLGVRVRRAPVPRFHVARVRRQGARWRAANVSHPRAPVRWLAGGDGRLKTETALPAWIFAGALLVGVTADQLLRSVPWGVNITICTFLLVAVGAALVRYHRLPVSTETWWLALTILLLGFAFAR